MEVKEFILYVAPRIVIDSRKRNLLPSPRIAQSIFESTHGTSELAVKANALFGVKDNDQWTGRTYSKESGEYENGIFLMKTSAFQAYDSWEESIHCQGEYLENRWISRLNPDVKRFSNLKDVRDYKQFAQLLKNDGYGTALDYDQRIIDYVERYGLTEYDYMTAEEAEQLISGQKEYEKTYTVALDAGHGRDTAGKRCMRSIDPAETREWVLNSRITEKVIDKLTGYPIRIIRVDDASGNVDTALAERVKQANDGKADIYISVHHDAGANGGKSGGVTIHSYDDGKDAEDPVARNLYECVVSRNGLRGNRSVPCQKSDFYVLKRTAMKALLLENGFMDSIIDTPVIITDSYAEKSADGIVAFILSMASIEPASKEKQQDSSLPATGEGEIKYKVQAGAFSNRENAEKLLKEMSEAGFSGFIIQEQR